MSFFRARKQGTKQPLSSAKSYTDERKTTDCIEYWLSHKATAAALLAVQRTQVKEKTATPKRATETPKKAEQNVSKDSAGRLKIKLTAKELHKINDFVANFDLLESKIKHLAVI